MTPLGYVKSGLVALCVIGASYVAVNGNTSGGWIFILAFGVLVMLAK